MTLSPVSPLGQGQVLWGMLEGKEYPLGTWKVRGEHSRLVAPTSRSVIKIMLCAGGWSCGHSGERGTGAAQSQAARQLLCRAWQAWQSMAGRWSAAALSLHVPDKGLH